MSESNFSVPTAANERRELTCTYDPLKEFLAHYADAKAVRSETSTYANMTIEERLKQRIIDGDKLGIDDDLNLALKSYPALEIINTILLDGMKVVGELFGSGEMQLPFVLESAETMKTAVRFLEPYMEKVEGESSKGVMVLATVKGDVHDIGKNLVDIILTNNGYRVVNLGIKVGLEAMLDAATREGADAIGMSGLLVKSTAIMKDNLEVMASRNITVPVVLGGAALTRRFVEKDLREIYSTGFVGYAQDAFDGLHFMEKLKAGKLQSDAAADTVDLQPKTIEALLRATQETHATFIGLLNEIEEEDYHVPNAFGKWSLRDVVAHIIGWERLATERIRTIKAGGKITPIYPEQVNEVNDAFVRESTSHTREALIGELSTVNDEVVTLAETLTEDEFSFTEGDIASVAKWLPKFAHAHIHEHMEKIHAWQQAQIEELDNATGADAKLLLSARALPWLNRSAETNAFAKSEALNRIQEEVADFPVAVRVGHPEAGVEKLERVSTVEHTNYVPKPPFWGAKIVDDIKLEKVWEYLNEIALFRGQWQIRRGKRSVQDYEKQIAEVAKPKLQELKLRAKRDRVLEPKVVYGYFPCYADGDDVVVLKPSALADDKLYQTWSDAQDLVEWQRFTFPRQPTARRLCIADYFLPKEDCEKRGQFDVLPLTAVTVGRRASEYTAELFQANEYAEYLFMHGLSVETAEALAEYWHKVVRAELGIGDKDADDVTRLFSQGYQGSRFSFGYPACPNLEDQTKLFELIRPERIDMTLTEEYHLEPEQSTTAIICHHPAAKYFSIK